VVVNSRSPVKLKTVTRALPDAAGQEITTWSAAHGVSDTSAWAAAATVRSLSDPRQQQS